MKRKLRFKTIFISDVHLGLYESKAAQLSHFLCNSYCEKLILNGDIIDAWALQRDGRWTKAHTHLLRSVLIKMEQEDMSVVYLRGNHDDLIERFIPMKLDNLSLALEYIHESPHGKYLVVHGDGFDHVTTNHMWLSKIGAVGYNSLLKLNRVFNVYRQWRGKPPFSFAKWVKAKVKGAVSRVGQYEEQLQALAKERDCVGIICGHIHAAADKRIGDIHYLNSGDWVESMTAVVEHLDRTFEVISYQDWCERTNRAPKGQTWLPNSVREEMIERRSS